MQKLIRSVLLIGCVLSLTACNSVTERLQDVFSDSHIAEKTQIDKSEVSNINFNELFLPAGDTAVHGHIALEHVYAVDGDTIKAVAKKSELESYGIPTSSMSGSGNYVSVTIRYLLIDTPESVHPTKKAQPFAKEAANRNSKLITSGNVSMQFGEGNKMDKYGRLLGYIYLDDVMVQEILLQEGFARIAYVETENKKTKQFNILQKAENKAKSQQVKVWSIPGYVTERGFND